MVYFIGSDKFVKIGVTKNIKNRLSELQVGSPFNLKVLALIEGNEDLEKKLHKKFRDDSARGEWFYLNERIWKYINTLSTDLMWFNGFISSPFIPMGKIKEARINKNISLQELAESMGITKQSLSELEIREVQGRATIKSINRAAKGLGMKFEYRIT